MSSTPTRKLLLTIRLAIGVIAGGAAGVVGAVALSTVQEAPAHAAPGDPGDPGTILPTTRSKAVPTTPFVASPTLKAPPYGKS